MPTIQIHHRLTGAVLFECDLPPKVAVQSRAKQLGYAVRQALKASANLADADLADADLAGAKILAAITRVMSTAQAYRELLQDLSLLEPHCGWYDAPKLTDAQLAIVLAAFPGIHDDALSDMAPAVTDIIDGLASAGALSPWALIGTTYRIKLVGYLRKQVLRDLQDLAEEAEYAQRFERPDIDSVNDAAAVIP